MSLDIPQLRDSFGLIAPRADQFAKSFYDRLFADHPELRSLFAGTSMEDQRQKLIQSLLVTMRSLDQPEKLQPFLQDLGERHREYNVMPRHYDLVGG
ncbi:hypothetical protein GYB59_24460, partial [bacterium]|nr:hypothetical protein [bacterium]